MCSALSHNQKLIELYANGTARSHPAEMPSAAPAVIDPTQRTSAKPCVPFKNHCQEKCFAYKEAMAAARKVTQFQGQPTQGFERKEEGGESARC